MTPATDLVTAAADLIDAAAESGVATSPVRHLIGDIDAAYEVQTEVIRRRVGNGATVVGRKIGLTSPAVQQQLGVDQPDFGVLLDDMGLADAATVPANGLLQPKAEAEVAFVLGRDLDGPLDLDIVRDAVEHAIPAIEIVDSRIADWDIGIVDTVADNGSSALYVLGDARISLSEVTPRDVEMTMTVDDVVASTGHGAACLGDPLEALLWLARAAQSYGDPLRSGQVVLSGALGPMVPVVPGNHVRAEITGLGSVSFTLGPGEDS